MMIGSFGLGPMRRTRSSTSASAGSTGTGTAAKGASGVALRLDAVGDLGAMLRLFFQKRRHTASTTRISSNRSNLDCSNVSPKPEIDLWDTQFM